MFGQVLDKLDTWFGRAFLLSRYFPCLLFAAANTLIACLEFATLRPPVLAALRAADSIAMVVNLVIGLAAIAVVAYVLSPVGQAVTRLLEGEFLPGWLTGSLVLFQTIRSDAAARRLKEVFQRRTALPDEASITARLAAARRMGARHRAVPDSDAITRADNALDPLRAARELRRSISGGELIAAVEIMADALRSNCAETRQLKAPVNPKHHAAVEQLDRLHHELTDQLLVYAHHIAEEAEARVDTQNERLFGQEELAPTRLGNEAAALRRYCRTRYGIEFDFFWPRFQLAIQKNDKLSAAIVTAKIQFDFAIFSLALTAASTAAWIMILVLTGQTELPLFLVVLFGLPMSRFWLWVVHESYRDFADVVRGAIDISRFDLLDALRYPLPPGSEAEKQIWNRAARQAQHGYASELPNVTLRHPSK